MKNDCVNFVLLNKTYKNRRNQRIYNQNDTRQFIDQRSVHVQQFSDDVYYGILQFASDAGILWLSMQYEFSSNNGKNQDRKFIEF